MAWYQSYVFNFGIVEPVIFQHLFFIVGMYNGFRGGGLGACVWYHSEGTEGPEDNEFTYQNKNM